MSNSNAKTATPIHRRNRHPDIRSRVAGVASWAIPAMAKTSSAPADTSKSATAATAPAFPTFVHLPADQAAHPNAPQEWWYVVGHLNAHGHRFGYEVQIVGGKAPQALIAITDKTTGAYYTQSQNYSPDQASFSTTALDVRVPSATLSGPMDAMHLHATLPVGPAAGRLDHPRTRPGGH
jgi:hypothetical protein